MIGIWREEIWREQWVGRWGGKGREGGCEKQVMLLRGFDREFGGRKFGGKKNVEGIGGQFYNRN